MDGIVASYEHKTIRFNTIMASADRLALDVTALKIAGMDISDIKYFSNAAERGLGTYKPSKIKIKGFDVETLSQRWRRKTSKIPVIQGFAET